MEFKVGDRIKFIDQVGSGTVTKIVSDLVLIIEDEDGFDYEVKTNQIMKSVNSEDEKKMYEKAPPREHEIFHKDVDQAKLEREQDKFKDLYKNENHKVKDSEVMEVDLHIHELVDYTSGMENRDMLDVQIRHFERMMKIAESKRFSKVVFIHGVGEGVLRGEIRRLIEQFYPNCSYRDGNYREYGMGATQIAIRYN